MKKTVKELGILISKKESKQALSLMIKTILENEVYFLEEIKKQGVFRCSLYDFDVNILQFLVNQVTLIKSLSNESINYFKSVNSLLFIGREFKKIFKTLNQEIDKCTFKSYLVSLDALFWPNGIKNNIPFSNSEYYKTFGYSKEELAVLFLFLDFSLIRKIVLITNSYTQLI